MDRLQLQQMLQMARGGGGAPAADTPMPDTSEKIQISSLSLLKMLKHGRAGVPMEVMGLMLGQFIDDYTISCVDVFAMPQVSNSMPIFHQQQLHCLSYSMEQELV
jgi:26S proteasome regulatory subunit N11